MTIDRVNDLVTAHKPSNPVPLVYFSCLAASKMGVEHGTWVDVTQTVAKIQADIQIMLTTSPATNATEWEISYYINVGTLLIDKDISLENLRGQALFTQKYGRLGVALLVYYGSTERAQEAILDGYYGQHISELDFAIDHFYVCYIGRNLRNVQDYIDYAAFQRDLFAKDFLSFKVDEKVHVFAKS